MSNIPEGFEPLFRSTPFLDLLDPLYNRRIGNDLVSEEKQVPLITASLSIDYAGAAREGDWVEINTDVQKVGRKMASANCYFTVESKRIARASAVFSLADA